MQRDVRSLFASQWTDTSVSRRALLKRAVWLGAALPAGSALLAACGGDDEPAATTADTQSTATTSSGAAQPTPTTVRIGASSSPAVAPTPQPTQAATAPVDSGTFVGVVRNQPNTADPHIGADNPTGKFLIAAYEPLIRVRAGTTELEPVLAEAWEVSSDGKTYTFTVRESVTFHDGSILDSEVVKLSIERMKKIGLGNAFVLNPVGQVVATDPQTVTITLSSVYVPFLESMPLVYIASGKAITENAQGDDLAQEWFKENEAGSGPYRLAEWTKNAKMTLTKFDDYWRGWGGPHFSQITLQLVPEGSTQRQLMEAGEADWADSIAVDDLVAMQKNSQFKVEANKSLSLYYIMMNTNRPPLDNADVRMALRYAFDYNAVANNIWQGLGFVPKGYLPEQYAAHNPNVPGETYDIKQAQTLIDGANIPNDQKTLELNYFNGAAWERPASELLADRLSQLGLELRLNGVPWPTMLTSLTDPNLRTHFAYFSATGSTSSPDSVLSKTFYSKSNHWSVFGYANPEIDTLIEKSQITLDDQERTQIFHEIQMKLHEDSPGINSVIGSTNHVFNSEIAGYTMLTFQPDLLDYYALYREE